MSAHQAPPSLGFSRQEHWSGLPFPPPMHESEKWKWSRSVVSNSSDPMDCSLPGSSAHGIFQAKVLEWGAIGFSVLNLNWSKIRAEITHRTGGSGSELTSVANYVELSTKKGVSKAKPVWGTREPSSTFSSAHLLCYLICIATLSLDLFLHH